jgi:AcrR family transcriptional regulator
MSRAKRTRPAVRREQLIDAAIKISKEIGYNKLTRDKVMKEVGITVSLLSYYFPRMSDLKNAVMDAAVERGIVEVIAQGITLNDPRALTINPQTKLQVIAFMMQT